MAERAALHLPPEVVPALTPIVEVVAELTARIAAYDKQIELMAKERYPETELLRQVPGVAVIAVARKLSVLLLRLWVTGEVYEPLRNPGRRGDAPALVT